MPEKVVEALVEGGKATPAPPLGPSLSQLKVNIKEVVDAINEKTKDFAGMKVPVKVIVDTETKEFRIEVGSPPVSQLVKKELGLEKLSKQPGKEIVGDLKMEQVVKIARMKMDSMLSRNLKNAVKSIVGACISYGVNVEGKHPKEVLKEIDEGKYDEIIKE